MGEQSVNPAAAETQGQGVAPELLPTGACPFPVGREAWWRGPQDWVCGRPLPARPAHQKGGRSKGYCEDPRHGPNPPLRAHRLTKAAKQAAQAAGQAGQDGPAGAQVGEELRLDDNHKTSDAAAALPVLREMWVQSLQERQDAIERGNQELEAILSRAADLAGVLDDPGAAASEVAYVRTQAEADISAATNRAEQAVRAERAARAQAEDAIEIRDEAVAALEEAEQRTAEQVQAAADRVEEVERDSAERIRQAEQEAAQARSDAEEAQSQAQLRIQDIQAEAAQQVETATRIADQRVTTAETDAQSRIQDIQAEAEAQVEEARKAAARDHDKAVTATTTAEAARAESERLHQELTALQARMDRSEQRHDQELERLRTEQREQRERDATVQEELRDAHLAQVAALHAQLQVLTADPDPASPEA